MSKRWGQASPAARISRSRIWTTTASWKSSLSQQDSYLYVLDSKGREKWAYLGYFWYHSAPTVADLQGTGELDIVFTAPETDGTYALRSGFTGKPGRAPWPMDRGGPERTNCAPW